MAIPAEVVGAVGSGEGATEQSSSIDTFSFASLRDQAMSAFGSEDTPVAEQSQEQVQTETPSTEDAVAEPPAQNVDNASAKQLANLKDDDLIEVTVDGEKVTMPWSEARGGVMRQAKFTKEMQQLRREQEQFNTERQSVAQLREEREALVKMLRSPEMLTQFVQKAYPTLFDSTQRQAAERVAEGSVDPDDIATVGQVQQVFGTVKQQLEHFAKQLQESIEARAEKLTTEIEDRQATAKLSEDINHTVKTLFKEHPYIEEVIPNADQLLRWQVLQLGPKTPEETLEAFKTVFGGWIENFNKTVQSRNKAAVIDKQKLVDNNIQPPGGAAPQPQPQTFKKKDGSMDWDAMRKVAESMLG